MAFSVLDGATDYGAALTARTAFEAPGIDITLPARCRVRFPGAPRAGTIVAGDWFRTAAIRVERLTDRTIWAVSQVFVPENGHTHVRQIALIWKV